jgi:hypothetical protein
MPLNDSSGHVIGILVMEIPFTSVTDQDGAVHEAEEIRKELSAQIPDYQSLFQN